MTMEGMVDLLNHTNVGIMIHNEILQREVLDRDKLLDQTRVELGMVHMDSQWILHVGVVQIMDKLIEKSDFANGVRRIKHIYFAIGEKSNCDDLKA